jgi:prepilin-type N-terminal cleavage/methylation domain-containing protein/prepilin-type processing-associated H-X9-DG protein
VGARRYGFTLIELIVVMAIMGILAAVLFPVFAAGRENAKRISCLSHFRQGTMATRLYGGDYDDTFYPHRFNCLTPGTTTKTTCPQYLKADGTLTAEAASFSGGAEQRFYWVFMLQPYAKNYQLFKNPGGSNKFIPGVNTKQTCAAQGCTGTNYGGQNSYGHNDAWLSPADPFDASGQGLAAAISQTSVDRPAGTIMVANGGYYGLVPDIMNQSGLLDLSRFSGTELTDVQNKVNGQGGQYKFYWKNIGGGVWSYSGGETGAYAAGNEAAALAQGKTLFGGKLNVQFVDGHAKSTDYTKLVSDVCLWASSGISNCN